MHVPKFLFVATWFSVVSGWCPWTGLVYTCNGGVHPIIAHTINIILLCNIVVMMILLLLHSIIIDMVTFVVVVVSRTSTRYSPIYNNLRNSIPVPVRVASTIAGLLRVLLYVICMISLTGIGYSDFGSRPSYTSVPFQPIMGKWGISYDIIVTFT